MPSLNRLGRSITNLKGSGGYNNNEKDVIYVVITRLEISKLKQIVHEVDATSIFNNHEHPRSTRWAV